MCVYIHTYDTAVLNLVYSSVQLLNLVYTHLTKGRASDPPRGRSVPRVYSSVYTQQPCTILLQHVLSLRTAVVCYRALRPLKYHIHHGVAKAAARAS